MEHIVEIIKALAWPVTVLISVFALRKPLVALLPQLKTFKYKELEMEFEKELDALSKKSQESRARIEIDVTPEEETDYYSQRVKELSPRAAIIESWIGLESTAISTAQQFGLAPKNKRVSFTGAMANLVKGGVLTQEDVININELRVLRNKAVHEYELPLTENEAAKFMEIARNHSDIIVSEAWQKYGGCRG